MKIDLKIILILILSVTCCFFFFKWINVTDDHLAFENKKLLENIKLIQKERDSLSKDVLKYEKAFKDLEQKIKEREIRINKLILELSKSETELKKSKKELNDLLSKFDEINKEIERIKSYPPKRSGDDLMNSMRKKLEKK